MRSSERHQLKQDRFAAATMDKVSWAVEHRNPLLIVSGILVVVVLIAIGAFYYQKTREQSASLMLGDALKLYSAPIQPAGSPAAPGETTFPSVTDRARAASQKFLDVTQKYGSTDSGAIAN